MAKPAAQVEVNGESMDNVCIDVFEKSFHLCLRFFYIVHIELEWDSEAVALTVTVCLQTQRAFLRVLGLPHVVRTARLR